MANKRELEQLVAATNTNATIGRISRIGRIGRIGRKGPMGPNQSPVKVNGLLQTLIKGTQD